NLFCECDFVVVWADDPRVQARIARKDCLYIGVGRTAGGGLDYRITDEMPDGAGGMRFTLEGAGDDDTLDFSIPFADPAAVQNAALALVSAYLLGASWQDLQVRAPLLTPVSMRT